MQNNNTNINNSLIDAENSNKESLDIIPNELPQLIQEYQNNFLSTPDSLLRYRPLEILKEVFNELYSMGYNKDVIFRKAFAAHFYLLKEEDVETLDIDNLVFENLPVVYPVDENRLDVDGKVLSDLLLNISEDSLDNPPLSDIENYARLYLLADGILVIGCKLGLITYDDLVHIGMIAHIIDYVMHEEEKGENWDDVVDLYYRKDAFSIIYSTIFLKACKEVYVKLSINHFDFQAIAESLYESEESNTEDYFSVSRFKVRQREFFRILKKLCKKDRIEILKFIEGADYDALCDCIEDNDVSSFCSILKQATNYEDVSALCNCYFKIKRFVKLLVYFSENHPSDFFLFIIFSNTQKTSKQYNTFKELSENTPATDNDSEEKQMFVKEVVKSLDTDSQIEKICKVICFFNHLLKPSVKSSVSKIIKQSPAEKYFNSIYISVKQEMETLINKRKNDKSTKMDLPSDEVIYNLIIELVAKTEPSLSKDYSMNDVYAAFDGIFNVDTDTKFEKTRSNLFLQLKTCETKFVYKELKLNWFLYIIGVMKKKGVYVHNATNIARTLFPTYDDKQIETVRVYIQSGKKRLDKNSIELIEVNC